MADRRIPGAAGGPAGRGARPQLDVVIPVFNEESGLSAFHANLREILVALPYACRVIYVDDGSTDRTAEVVAALPAAGYGWNACSSAATSVTRRR